VIHIVTLTRMLQGSPDPAIKHAISQASLNGSPLQPIYNIRGESFRIMDAKETGQALAMIGGATLQPELMLAGAAFYIVGALMD
jgi:hypothetical protein